MTIVDVDHQYLDASAGVFKVNETANALNLTFKLKVVLPDDSKVTLYSLERSQLIKYLK